MTSADASRPELPIAEVVATFLRLGVEQRAFARLLVWEGLAGGGSDAEEPDAYFTDMVADLRRRQRAGELADRSGSGVRAADALCGRSRPDRDPADRPPAYRPAARLAGVSKRRTPSSCGGSSSGWPTRFERVAQSVELTFDAAAEAALVAQWDRLAAAGVDKPQALGS